MGFPLSPPRRSLSNLHSHSAKPEALEAAYFEPGLTYTFSNSQPLFAPADYSLDIAGLAKFEFDEYLGARDAGVPTQPILIAMAKDVETGEYLWNFELWHEKLVQPVEESKDKEKERGSSWMALSDLTLM